MARLAPPAALRPGRPTDERPALGYAALLMVVAGLAFELLYAGANAVTALHHHRVPIAFAWEHAIPFAPEWVVAYWSLWPMTLLAPFLVRTTAAFQRLIWLIVAETAVAAVFFVLLPAEVAYAPATDLGAWRGVYDLTATVSMSHNLFPSLHVAFAVTFALVYAQGRSALTAAVLYAWAATIAASTLLLHLHHVVDLVGGALLAWTATTFWRVPPWAFSWSDRRPATKRCES